MTNWFKTPFTLLIHIALAIIVAGAFVTHFDGIQGTLHLEEGGAPVSSFTKTSGPGDGRLPFSLALDSAQVVCYPGTVTPMDFRSVLSTGDGRRFTVAMNSVAEIDHWRFYQSGMGQGSSTLSVSHDPIGTGITYTGYILLGLGMIGFFFQRRTLWRALLRRKGAVAVALLCLIPGGASASDTTQGASGEELHYMQRPLARNFGKIYVYWNDRVSPLQTMALDVTSKLYGSRTYRGLSAEQVLSGWLFYYDEWMRDYDATHPYPDSEKGRKKEDERRALIRWVGSGAAFRIYPYKASTGRMEWLSLCERRPSKMSLEQWQFMATAMPEISRLLLSGRNVDADKAISRLIEGQCRYGGLDTGSLPYRLEIYYNRWVRLWPAALLMLIFGAWGIWRGATESPRRQRIDPSVGLTGVSLLAAVFFGIVLGLRGVIGHHWPLSNGCETMLFMAFASAVGAIAVRGELMKGALLLVAAMATFVAAMGENTPQIASLMPVLASPLLSIHVMLVMCSYVGFMLMAILSAVALVRGGDTSRRLARVNSIILVPAEFLLTVGIFVGAVWANQSWGRYWGWDPKETCALITMLIYAIPLHRAVLRTGGRPWFSTPRSLHIFLLVAILSVIFTYFGANYLLPGLHSYA